MNTIFFDLNNEILEIIGDYVKKDNHDRMDKEINDNYCRRKDEESQNVYKNMLIVK
jgi:hypothetical protein